MRGLLRASRSGAGLPTRAALAHLEATHVVRELARKQGPAELEQLVARTSYATRSSASADEDPFVKIKGLISVMIERLEQEAGVDATKPFATKSWR